jgi:hypothetical protein
MMRYRHMIQEYLKVDLARAINFNPTSALSGLLADVAVVELWRSLL